MDLRASLGPIAKMVVASLVMWLACFAVHYLPFYPSADTKLTCTAQLAILMKTGALVYFGSCVAMGLPIGSIRRNSPH